MDFGTVVNSALVKAGLSGYANSGMHNPHLHAQIAQLLSNVILPKLPASLAQQLMKGLRLNPQGFNSVLITHNPEVEVVLGLNTTKVHTGQDFIFNIKTGQFMTSWKIDRIVSIRRERHRERVLFPAPYPDANHFSATRQSERSVLLEFPTLGDFNNDDLIIEIMPQLEFTDIGSPLDIPSNTASYLIVALACELAEIYGDKPELAQHLLRELAANTHKASQDLEDWTVPQTTPLQKMNRFRNWGG